MTVQFEQLQKRPQTKIDRGGLGIEERLQVRKIDVRGTNGLTSTNSKGRFTTVYYLEPDVQSAAEVFVEENTDLLRDIDFSKTNVLQTSLPRPVYDWILHAIGERVLEKYETVVRDTRRDGSTWLISRNKFENNVNRRYATSERGTAYVPPELSLGAIFADAYVTITEEGLQETAIEGDVREVLDFFRHSTEFPCQPVMSDEMLAVTKADAESQPATGEKVPQ